MRPCSVVRPIPRPLQIFDQLPVQEIADVIQRLLGGLQERDVGRKDVDHALSSMHLDRPTLLFEPLAVPDGVVEENVDLTRMHSDRGQAGKPRQASKIAVRQVCDGDCMDHCADDPAARPCRNTFQDSVGGSA